MDCQERFVEHLTQTRHLIYFLCCSKYQRQHIEERLGTAFISTMEGATYIVTDTFEFRPRIIRMAFDEKKKERKRPIYRRYH